MVQNISIRSTALVCLAHEAVLKSSRFTLDSKQSMPGLDFTISVVNAQRRNMRRFDKTDPVFNLRSQLGELSNYAVGLRLSGQDTENIRVVYEPPYQGYVNPIKSNQEDIQYHLCKKVEQVCVALEKYESSRGDILWSYKIGGMDDFKSFYKKIKDTENSNSERSPQELAVIEWAQKMAAQDMTENKKQNRDMARIQRQFYWALKDCRL